MVNAWWWLAIGASAALSACSHDWDALQAGGGETSSQGGNPTTSGGGADLCAAICAAVACFSTTDPCPQNCPSHIADCTTGERPVIAECAEDAVDACNPPSAAETVFNACIKAQTDCLDDYAP